MDLAHTGTPSPAHAPTQPPTEVPAQGPLQAAPGARRWQPLLSALIAAVCVYLNVRVAYGLDQALFLYVSQWLNSGALLYLDVWDIKQPGIYWYYQFAQWLLGEGWPSVVALYALTMGAAAAVATAVLLRCWPGSRAWWLVPLATAGMTALRMTSDHYAEIEGIVCLPLAGILWLGLLAVERAQQRATAHSAQHSVPHSVPHSALYSVLLPATGAGALAGVVAVFKLALSPVAGSLFLILALHPLRRRRIIPEVLCFAAGFCLLQVPVLLHLQAQGTLDLFLWTTFRFPLMALSDIPLAPLHRLVMSLGWLAFAFVLTVPAIWFALREALRQRSSLHAAAVAGLCTWIATAMVMILLQKFSWWGYHMELLLWPIGILACLGAAAGLATARSSGLPRVDWVRHVAWLSVVAALALNLAHTTRKRLKDEHWTLSGQAAQSLQQAARMGSGEGVALPCRTAYVFGDARMLLQSGLKQNVPEVGMNWFSFLPVLTRRLTSELGQARPDLIYVDLNHQVFFEKRAPQLAQWMQQHYRQVASDDMEGQWHARREANTAAACPAPLRFQVPAAEPGRPAGDQGAPAMDQGRPAPGLDPRRDS